MKKECPSCAMEIDAKSKVCPICSYEFTSTGGRKWIAIFFLIIALLWLVINLVSCRSPNPEANDSIGTTINSLNKIALVDSCSQRTLQLERSEFKLFRTDQEIVFEIKDIDLEVFLESMNCPYMKLFIENEWVLVEPYREHRAILPESMFYLIANMQGKIKFFDASDQGMGNVFVIKPGLNYR